MGSVTLPQSGSVYVDAQVIIYSIERRKPYADSLRPFWEAVQANKVVAVTSELSILETLVVPFRNDDQDLIRSYEAFFDSRGLLIVRIDEPTLRLAARLRANHPSLKSADAIHAATAIEHKVNHVLSNDRQWSNLGLPGLVLLD